MPLPEQIAPVRMQRIALVALKESLRSMLVRVADAGVVDLDEPSTDVGDKLSAAERLRRLSADRAAPRLARSTPDLGELEQAERTDLLAGEAALEERAAGAVERGSVAAVAGWCPETEVANLTANLAAIEAAVVPLPPPPGVDPPTLLHTGGRMRRSFSTLVSTYGVVPYHDVDPTLLAGIGYVAMFGMMFGDVGQGLLLLIGAMLLRADRPRRWPGLHKIWPFVAGAALASIGFGFLYGEFFGPTGVIPVIWLAPMDSPIPLLLAGIAVGAVMLSGAYVLAIINRWREGGPRLAVYASSGVAGASMFLGLGLLSAGLYVASGWLVAAGGVVATVGLTLAGIGFYAESGGGAGGAFQVFMELYDSVLRLGSNVLSFARLAAFGLAHAALGSMVWDGTTALAAAGGVALALAVLVFVLGNAVSFALEGLVAGIQALRLEFYELFSRLFQAEGRPFVPWHVPTWDPDDALEQEAVR